MAKGDKTGGKNFKTGQSGNPNGRPPLPEDVKVTRSAPQADFDATLDSLAFLPSDEVGRIAKDPKTPALMRAVAKCLYLAGRSGDPRRMAVVKRVSPQKIEEGAKSVLSFIDLVYQAEQVKRDGKS